MTGETAEILIVVVVAAATVVLIASEIIVNLRRERALDAARVDDLGREDAATQPSNDPHTPVGQ